MYMSAHGSWKNIIKNEGGRMIFVKKVKKFKEKYGGAAVAALLGVKDSRTVSVWIARKKVPDAYLWQVDSMKEVHFKRLRQLVYED